jgi:hypothetical protein
MAELYTKDLRFPNGQSYDRIIDIIDIWHNFTQRISFMKQSYKQRITRLIKAEL